MAFPTIPTVASGDLLSNTTSPASTTHTFPNLSSLRGGAGPQAGDLLIAICVQYGAATAGNQYSSWGASFSESLDDSLSSGTGVAALGIAYKIASGSESGTFTVTSANSFKSVQFLMRIPAGTWHGTTIPEVQAATRATGAAADSGAFNPSNWAIEDTLWISVAGQTETSTTGSPPIISAAPSNYSGELIVARVADAVGDITAAVAFRQLNADSDDVGLWTGSNFNRGNGIATVIAVRPAAPPPPTSTSVAEISLASHGTPSEYTNHSIKIRARTTSGSTGVIKAALYEGATNRSGDLTSSVLTNSLADYTLTIPNASAENITDYSDLSIRFWGYDSAGNALVFEVADVYLELPEASVTTYYGITSLVTTFNKSVSGFKETFGQVAAPFTFGTSVAGDILAAKQTSVAEISLASHGTPSERTNHSIRVRARTTSGSTGVIRAALYEGTTNRSGDLSSLVLTNSLADYILTIPDASAENIIDYSNLSIRIWGYDSEGNALVFEVADVYLELPEVGAATYYGMIVAPVTFVKTVAASRQTFGQTVTAFTFTKAVSGLRTAFGQVVAPFAFTKAVAGVRTALSQIAASFTFVKIVNGKLGTFGAIVRPFTFTKDVNGQRQTFSQIAVPFTFVKVVSGKLGTFGVITRPFTFTKTVSGKLGTFGVITRPVTFTKSVLATKQTFAQMVRPFTFVKDVSGRKTTFGQIIAPFTFVKNISAIRRSFGQVSAIFTFGKAVGGISIFINRISATFTFTKNVSGTRQTFSQIAVPFTFIKVVSGTKQTFGQIIRPFTFVKNVTGKLGAFSQIVSSFTFTKSIIGNKQTFAQIVRPFTFAKNVVINKTTFGQSAVPLVFGKSVSGIRITFSQIAAFFTFTKEVSGQRTTFSRVDLPLIFIDQTSGNKETFGQIGLPINFTFDVVAEVQGIRFGATSMSLVFDKDVAGIRETFGQVESPHLFNRTIQSSKTTFGQLDRPFEFLKETIGQRETFSSLAFPINASIIVAGTTSTNIYGQIALSLVLGEQTAGHRETFGQVTTPYNFDSELTGLLEAFSSLDFPVDFLVDVNTGRVEAHSSLALEFLLSLETAGIIRSGDIILNLAQAIYLGSTEVDAVYVDSQNVWSK